MSQISFFFQCLCKGVCVCFFIIHPLKNSLRTQYLLLPVFSFSSSIFPQNYYCLHMLFLRCLILSCFVFFFVFFVCIFSMFHNPFCSLFSMLSVNNVELLTAGSQVILVMVGLVGQWYTCNRINIFTPFK